MFTSALLSDCSLLRSVPFLFSHPYTANGLFSSVGSSLFYRAILSCVLTCICFHASRLCVEHFPMFTSALLSDCSLLRSVPFLFSHPYTANGLFSPVGSSLFYQDILSCVPTCICFHASRLRVEHFPHVYISPLIGLFFFAVRPFSVFASLYRERIIFLCGQQPLLSGYSLLRPDL